MFQEAVSDRMLLLIEAFGKIDEIQKNFYMAGGTALALQLGHRKSIDIDLFCRQGFDSADYTRLILDKFENVQIIESKKNSIHCTINEVMVSFLHYSSELLKPTVNFHKIKLASLEDIACMKVIAISQRGEKKDFFDVFEILKKYSAEAIRNLLIRKYGSRKINCYHILKSLFYFDDAETDAEPVSLNNTSWDDVKNFFLTSEQEIRERMGC